MSEPDEEMKELMALQDKAAMYGWDKDSKDFKRRLKEIERRFRPGKPVKDEDGEDAEPKALMWWGDDCQAFTKKLKEDTLKDLDVQGLCRKHIHDATWVPYKGSRGSDTRRRFVCELGIAGATKHVMFRKEKDGGIMMLEGIKRSDYVAPAWQPQAEEVDMPEEEEAEEPPAKKPKSPAKSKAAANKKDGKKAAAASASSSKAASSKAASSKRAADTSPGRPQRDRKTTKRA